MRRSSCLVGAGILFAACRPGESAWTMHAASAGGVRFGMSAAAAQLVLNDTSAVPSGECTYWRPRAGDPPGGVSFMVERGVVVRADVDSAGARTAEGIGVGSTEAEITSAYGRHVTIQLHKYQWEAGWRYFRYLPPGDSLNAILFETDGRRVRSYRVGRRPQVEYAERCG
jgi:hypothetical protein